MRLAVSTLTDLDRSILEVERRWWKYQGAKTSFILEWFGWSPTIYYVHLNQVLANPAAEAYDPPLVRRLRRLAGRRRAARDWAGQSSRKW